MENKIARVFPRKTNATPVDENAFVGRVPDVEVDEIMVSVTFSWDIPAAEKILKICEKIAPTKIGGPALGDRGEDFTPGLFLGNGYIITSRGCPNSCCFCDVPRREGGIRELPIQNGWNVLDSNLLACSDSHVEKVFSMLSQQTRRPRFTGGLEAKRLRDWHCKRLKEIKADAVFVAYDTPDDLEPMIEAGKRLISAGFTKASHKLRAYVLCGFQGDSISKAEKRMFQTWSAGFMPMAMLFRGKDYQDWTGFQRSFARPAFTAAIFKAAGYGK